jgi:hypothetical protein
MELMAVVSVMTVRAVMAVMVTMAVIPVMAMIPVMVWVGFGFADGSKTNGAKNPAKRQQGQHCLSG